jgi:hypothetical protein
MAKAMQKGKTTKINASSMAANPVWSKMMPSLRARA